MVKKYYIKIQNLKDNNIEFVNEHRHTDYEIVKENEEFSLRIHSPLRIFNVLTFKITKGKLKLKRKSNYFVNIPHERSKEFFYISDMYKLFYNNTFSVYIQPITIIFF